MQKVFDKIGSVMGWLGWLLTPLLGGLQSLPFVVVMVSVLFGVRAGMVEIPPRDQLILVEGRLLAPHDGQPSKSDMHATRVRGENGVVHQCTCGLGWSLKGNCLDERDVALNTQYAQQLHNQPVSLLMAPTPPAGRARLCYELAGAGKTWYGYEEKSRAYAAIQNGWTPTLSWAALVLLGAFLAIRAVFFRPDKSKAPNAWQDPNMALLLGAGMAMAMWVAL